MSNVIESWKERARTLKRDIYAVWLARKHPRTPWYAKALGACVVGYAFSPIDLIPDPIPILGYLDDLVIVPAGIFIVLRLIPPDVLVECREQAQQLAAKGKPKNWFFAGVIVVIWLALAALAVVLISHAFRRA